MEKQTVAKMAITSDADVALIQALEKVNQGNTGGRITKLDLASWFILNGAAQMSQATIDEVRLAHFNQAAYLENLLRTLKQSGRQALSFEEIDNLQTLLKRKDRVSKKPNKSETKNHANTDSSQNK